MWKSSLKSHARMHAKMSAVHNPPSLSVRPHSNARLHASESAVAKSSHRVSKRKGKNASPSVKRKSCQPRHTVSAADANFAIIAPNVVSAVAGVPLQIPSDKKQALSEKHNTGRQSPDSVTMLDRDAAKVLTMFQ